jgi:hypothetical protein
MKALAPVDRIGAFRGLSGWLSSFDATAFTQS